MSGYAMMARTPIANIALALQLPQRALHSSLHQ